MLPAHPAVVERARLLVGAPEEADAFLEVWMRRFVGVSDRGLRRTVLGTCLGQADDGTLLGVLSRLDGRADRGDAVARWMVTELALTPSLLHELPYERRVELYVAARAAGLDHVAGRLLTGPQPPAPESPTDNPHLDRSAGERTALARATDRLVLDRVAHDRDPRVIRVFLDNPRITERDAVRVAAMRPTVAEVLLLVARHPRWSQRYTVRKALAFNPHTPAELSRQLLPTLLRQDLEALLQSHLLHPGVRAEVRARLGLD